MGLGLRGPGVWRFCGVRPGWGEVGCRGGDGGVVGERGRGEGLRECSGLLHMFWKAGVYPFYSQCELCAFFENMRIRCKPARLSWQVKGYLCLYVR